MARRRDRDGDGGCLLDAGLDSRSTGIRVERLAGKTPSVADAFTDPDPPSDSKPNPTTDTKADPAADAGPNAAAECRTGARAKRPTQCVSGNGSSSAGRVS